LKSIVFRLAEFRSIISCISVRNVVCKTIGSTPVRSPADLESDSWRLTKKVRIPRDNMLEIVPRWCSRTFRKDIASIMRFTFHYRVNSWALWWFRCFSCRNSRYSGSNWRSYVNQCFWRIDEEISTIYRDKKSSC
jgi:hypothetical protein